MKKISVLLASALILSATVAFAVDGTGTFGATYSTPDGAGNLTYAATGVGAGVNFAVKTSANVKFSLQNNATDGTSYVAAAYHSSGSKSYATGSGDSRIYMQEKAATATAYPAPPTLAATVDWAGWTAVK